MSTILFLSNRSAQLTNKIYPKGEIFLFLPCDSVLRGNSGVLRLVTMFLMILTSLLFTTFPILCKNDLNILFNLFLFTFFFEFSFTPKTFKIQTCVKTEHSY